MSVFVCARALGSSEVQPSLAKCPANAINTGRSHNPQILYHQSSWGPTLRVSVSLSKTPSMLWRKPRTHTHPHIQTHAHTHTRQGSYSYNRWRMHVTDKQGHSLEESCIHFQLCCSADPTVAACVLAPLTESPTPPGLVLIPSYDFNPPFSHRLHFHRHWSTRQVQRRVGRRRKGESSGG